ncbi:hypothetical protein [Leptospira kirschneri]|uniref:hypothetical protein n=1 Tax=Leptospira kirschneri TaxID=29507 RepID=UPI0018DED5A2|nr:hypothetical protein [Leptospira kirschneri]
MIPSSDETESNRAPDRRAVCPEIAVLQKLPRILSGFDGSLTILNLTASDGPAGSSVYTLT